MSESTDRTGDQASAAELVSLLFGLGRALNLYEVNNAAIGRLVDGVAATLDKHRAHGGGPLKLELLAEEFFVNGSLLAVDPRLYERATELARGLDRFRIGSLAFDGPCERAVVTRFATDWAASLRGGQSAFAADGYPGITLGQAEVSIASFRFDPDRLALWLYASLLDLTEEVAADHAAGVIPSLLQVRRLLQLTIDGLARHAPTYELLAAARNPTRALGAERLRVAIAVEAIGFGHHLGLAKRRLMTLGLGGLLGGLASSADPDAAVEPLLGFPGLGDAAPALVVTLHDARRIRAGGTGGLSGHVLALAERYVEECSGDADPASPVPNPARVVERLASSGDALASAFAAHKGRYPLGSPVTLSDGSLAVVLALGAGPDPRPPVVAHWRAPAELGEPLDLAAEAELSIIGTPPPAEAGVDLTAVRGRADDSTPPP
ncbi:MAG: hypothetical protein IPK07_30770 [Deltaproteobacteria bacterium]|nr:hypothetical protein [Deltaproteobacteria bacterium]